MIEVRHGIPKTEIGRMGVRRLMGRVEGRGGEVTQHIFVDGKWDFELG